MSVWNARECNQPLIKLENAPSAQCSDVTSVLPLPMASPGSLGPPTNSRDSSSSTQGGHTAGSSPLNAEMLIAARKGNTDQVERCLREGGGAGAATTDKVSCFTFCSTAIDRDMAWSCVLNVHCSVLLSRLYNHDTLAGCQYMDLL